MIRRRGTTMTEVMDSHIVELGPRPDAAPGVLKVGQMAARFSAGDHPRVLLVTGQALQQPHRRRRQRHRPTASLGVGKVQLPRLQVDMLPPQLLDLRQPAPR